MIAQPLELSADMVRIISDRVQNTDLDEGRPIAKRLLIKLAGAFLEMLPPDKPTPGTYTIWVNEPECWLIRSKVNSGDRTDSEPKLGIILLRRLYETILAFDTADATGDLLTADAPDRSFKAATEQAEIDARFPPGDDGLAATH